MSFKTPWSRMRVRAAACVLGFASGVLAATLVAPSSFTLNDVAVIALVFGFGFFSAYLFVVVSVRILNSIGKPKSVERIEVPNDGEHTVRMSSGVLRGCELLRDDELSFLILLGQLSNELTAIHRILRVTNRSLPNHGAQQANAVVIAMLEKLLASKLWQGWELVRTAFYGTAVSSSDWLRSNEELTQHLRAMRRHFPDGCRFEVIRNQFGFHYDLDAISAAIGPTIAENGFSILHGDQVVNTFFPTSEVVTWTSLIGKEEDESYLEEYSLFLKDLYSRSDDFIGLVKLIVEAFFTRVRDLGGSVDELDEFEMDAVSTTEKVDLPLVIS